MTREQQKLKVARNYATALFKEVPDTERDQCLGVLKKVAKLFESNQELKESLIAPIYCHLERAEVLAELALRNTKNVSERLALLFRNFTKVLLEHGRVEVLPEISESFSAQLDMVKRISRVHVTTAFELPEEEKQNLVRSLQTNDQRVIEVTFIVDSELLGGVILETNGQIHDSSIRGKLQKLRSELRA
jgi:F-type H+-transporting ATPase subunit delta